MDANRFIKEEDGGTAVEFAIILPLLLSTIFGIIEFSLFFYNKQVITNAAREGARRGVITRAIPRNVATENIVIRNRVIEFAQDYLVTFGTDTLTNTNADIPLDDTRLITTGTDLTVQVNYSYDFLFLSTMDIGPINIRGLSTMKME